jgi:histidinol-phosphatase (PHP family)
MTLTGDAHVHSEWSWDTGGPTNPDAIGRMELTCERAVLIGLPALCFTEHYDFGSWTSRPADERPLLRSVIADGILTPPPLDIEGYLESIERCRRRFPDLTIMTGVEFGEPHQHRAEAEALAALDSIDRVNGSLHRIPLGGERSEPGMLLHEWSAAEVMWAYLEELPRMVAGSDVFEVFTHIDWVARYWPVEALGPFDPRPFEEGFRSGMRALAGSGRVLELNTRRLWPWMPQWWSEEGGKAITFGSDAHVPEALAAGFPEAMLMAEHYGFRPGRRPLDFWTR